jgi:CelD/BcsL family acetyltransferase involved in cellulose biosynthesis
MVARSISAKGIEARLEPVTDPDRLRAAWRALEPRCEASFFQSWSWIGCWLRHVPSDRKPLAAIAARNGEVVGLGVFVPCRERRHGIVGARTLRLHESGVQALDSLYVEHNGLLADRPHAPEVWAAILAELTRNGAGGELALGGLARPTADACIAAARSQGLDVVVRQRRPGAWLDLERLRRTGRPFADALSRNTRHQFVRARALYQASGPLSLRPAQSAEEALQMLDRLKTLHQRSWERRGRPGCFAAPAFEAFHRDLIRERFRRGEIRLLCAQAGDRPFGYLYNFARGGRIYAYQSGFDYPADGRFKPGLVSHALAIEQALRDGFAVYDFMAGENRLKASFASDWDDVIWLAVRRRSALSWLERRFTGSKPEAVPVSPRDRRPDRPDGALPARAGDH